MTVDRQVCANLVREITDEIAATSRPSGDTRPLDQIIVDVRATSKRAEKRMQAALSSLYPTIGWTGEEDEPDAAEAWLYDPIDGAYHYLQSLPLWSASLVLVRSGVPVLAIIYEPAAGELFVASEGDGATCNGAPLRASAKQALGTAVVGTAIPPIAQVGPVEQAEALSILSTVASKVFVVRPLAAASLQLAYVAAGRLDAYWETGHDPADWLAGTLLVREAGGHVSALDGSPFGVAKGVLAAGPNLHSLLLPHLSTGGTHLAAA
jgi:myo-inositol-1(or 4)-monophosphatase